MFSRRLAVRIVVAIAGTAALGFSLPPVANADPGDCFAMAGVGFCVPSPWQAMASFAVPEAPPAAEQAPSTPADIDQ
ncbi:MAG: hypothetical protein HYZ38_02610 [Mycobacterium sp.]|nr:hypothetical protein [Mycobacterium sp.]